MAENTVITNADRDKWEIQEEARNEMAQMLEEKVFNPMGLLAGLLANVKEDDEEVSLSVTGYLLGLVVTGARKELEIQKMGGSDAYWLSKLLED